VISISNMPITPEAVAKSAWEFDFEFCELCLGIMEWLASIGTDVREKEFEADTTTTCQFCDEVLQKPKQAMPKDGISEPRYPFTLDVLPRNSELCGEEHLNSGICLIWKSSEHTYVDFAIWTEKRMQNLFACILPWADARVR
jgi:hypothetical protein